MRPLPILFFTLLLDTISVGLLIPILPALFNDPASSSFLLAGYSVGAQYFIAGAITAVFGLMQFIAAPILGELSDAYGRKRLLTIGVAVLAFSNFMFAFGIGIGSLALLFVSRTLAGLAGANFSIAQATIADVSAPEQRARNFGLIGAAFGVGFILGPLLGGLIASYFNYAAAPFWFAGCLGLLNVLFVSLFLPETNHDRRAAKSFTLLKGIRNIKAAMQDAEAAPVYLTSFLYMSGFAFFTSFVGVLLSVEYGLTEAGIGTFFGIVGACIVVTQVAILPQAVKRYPERKIMLWGFPVVALCVLLYPFMDTITLLYILIPIMAVPQGLAFANIASLVSKSVPADRQGAALGINGSLMALAQGVIPLLAGAGTGLLGIRLPFVAGALLILSAWYVLFRSVRELRRRAQN
ncbi:MAG TPA: MFS transporter [Candidatus Paceibacterota bacterium]|jgi:DHA1 family tetracycline resistance protein-like MFS transporter